jgi:oligopeptide transport system substrate-binding protein
VQQTSLATLHIANGSEPASLDPHIACDLQGISVLRGLFEGLVAMDEVTLEPLPAVAEQWEISSDGCTYLFTLRPDAKWSDGSAVCAGDFVNALQRLLTTSIASPLVDLAFPVKKCRPYYEGKVPWEEVGIRALDDRHLEIALEKPTAYFLALLTHPAWSPISKKNLQSFGAMERRDTPWAQPPHMLSNGPYALKEWRIGDRIVIEKNVYYHGSDDVAVERVVFYPLTDKMAVQNAFFAGEIDITASVSENFLDDFRIRYPQLFHETASLHSFYYIFNCEHFPLDDRRVRRALSMAIDRSALCRLIHFDAKFAAGNLVPPGVGGYCYSGENLGYQPEEARRLLAEAGFPGGVGFPQLSLTFNTSNTHQFIAQVIQEMWKRELGIEVILRNEEWKSFLITRRSGNYDIGRGGWVGDFNDPQTFLELFQCNAPNNYTRWHHQKFDHYMEKAVATTSEGKRRSAYAKAEAILMAEAPILPLYFDTNRHLISSRIRGWHSNLIDYHLYQNITIKNP